MKKKLLYLSALLLGTTAFVACQKEDIENTATVSMAGQWYCVIDAVDEAGNPITHGEDYFGEGKTIWLAYNTSANTPSEMWIDNLGIGNFAASYKDYFTQYIDILEGDIEAAKEKYFYGFPELEMPGFPSYALKTKVAIDQNAMTFRSTESENQGDGYQWWVKVVDRDEKGDTIWADDDKTEPQMVDSLLHEVKSMPVTVEGKILKGAGRQNNGSVADSIIFFVTYKGDPWYPGDGYTRYRVSGIRYSGLEENE